MSPFDVFEGQQVCVSLNSNSSSMHVAQLLLSVCAKSQTAAADVQLHI